MPSITEIVDEVTEQDDLLKKNWHNLKQNFQNDTNYVRHLVLLEQLVKSGELVESQNASKGTKDYLQSFTKLFSKRKTDARNSTNEEDGPSPRKLVKRIGDTLPKTAGKLSPH